MIQIKNPCDANWQEMTPAESGKYCGACEKVVVDFSKMNDVQIKEYFNEYATQKTCGRFLASQIDRPLQVSSTAVSSHFWKQVSRFPVFKSVMLLWATSVMWLTSCVNKDRVTGEADNQTCEPMVTGDTVAIPVGFDTSVTTTEPNSLPVIQESDGIKMGGTTTAQAGKSLPDQVLGNFTIMSDPRIVPIAMPTKDSIIPMITGKVKMADTISQKIIRKKK